MATIQQLQAYGYEYRNTQAGHLLVLQPKYVAYVSEILEAAGMRGIVSCNANNLSKQMCVDVEWKDATSQCDRYQQFFVSEQAGLSQKKPSLYSVVWQSLKTVWYITVTSHIGLIYASYNKHLLLRGCKQPKYSQKSVRL